MLKRSTVLKKRSAILSFYFLLLTCVSAFLLLTLVAATDAQTATATLSGTVVDQNGAVVAGAFAVLLALGSPVQFYVGRQFYVNGYKSLRNGSANMDVLVALGTLIWRMVG